MPDPSSPDEIATALLAYLRETTGSPLVSFAEAPQPLLGGNRTFVYGFRLSNAPASHGGPLILRVLRPSSETDGARFESAVQTALAAADYPVPHIITWSNSGQPLGGAFQIMERLPGGPILLGDPPEEMTGRTIFLQLLPDMGRVLLGNWPRLLAEVQVRLHELDTEAFLRRLEADGVPRSRLSVEAAVRRFAAEVEEHNLDGLRPAVDWLNDHRPRATDGGSICHGDFFPNQVFAQEGSVVGVIDWSDVIIGPAELDVGIVKAGIETLPGPLGPVGVALQRFVSKRYVTAYRKLRALDTGALDYSQAFRCVLTLLSVATRRLAIAEAETPEPGPNPYDHPLAEARLTSRLCELTGVRATIPPSRK